MQHLAECGAACRASACGVRAARAHCDALVHRDHRSQVADRRRLIPAPSQQIQLHSDHRRAVLVALGTLLCPLRSASAESLPPSLHSERSSSPCAMTVQNMRDSAVMVFWVNYDGEAELFGVVPPGGSYTIDTYETHPWRFVDAATGKTLQEWTATTGEQMISVKQDEPSSLPEQGRPGPSMLLAGGFDGLGGAESSYCPATLSALSIEPEGAVASLAMEGFQAPLPIYVGVAEAAAIFSASGMETRRPSTVSAWQASLKAAGASVKRIVITRLVGHTYYARLVLGLDNGDQRSVDARPSDSIALAMRTEAPLFVSRSIASEQTAKPLDRLMKPDLNPKGPSIHADKLQALEDDEKIVL